MQIGTFQKQDDGKIVGHLPTLHFHGVTIEPIEKVGEGPDYRCTVEGAELGAAWKKLSQKGTVYLSLVVTVPGQESIHIAVFSTEVAGQYVATWSEPKKKTAKATTDKF